MRFAERMASIKTGARGYFSSKSSLARTITRQERLITAQLRLREITDRGKRYAEDENAHLRRAFFNARAELVALASSPPDHQQLRLIIARMDHDMQTRAQWPGQQSQPTADPNAVSRLMAADGA